MPINARLIAIERRGEGGVRRGANLEVCAAQEFDGLAKIGNRQIVNRESSIIVNRESSIIVNRES